MFSYKKLFNTNAAFFLYSLRHSLKRPSSCLFISMLLCSFMSHGSSDLEKDPEVFLEKLRTGHVRLDTNIASMREKRRGIRRTLYEGIIGEKKEDLLESVVQYWRESTLKTPIPSFINSTLLNTMFSSVIRTQWVKGIELISPLLPDEDLGEDISLLEGSDDFIKALGEHGLRLLLDKKNASFYETFLRRSRARFEGIEAKEGDAQRLKEMEERHQALETGWQEKGLLFVRDGLKKAYRELDGREIKEAEAERAQSLGDYGLILRTLYGVDKDTSLESVLKGIPLWKDIMVFNKDTDLELKEALAHMGALLSLSGIEETEYYKTPIEGLLPIHHAAKVGFSYMVKHILDNFPDCVREKDIKEGNRPLHYGVLYHHPAVVSKVLHYVKEMKGIEETRSIVLLDQNDKQDTPLDISLRHMADNTLSDDDKPRAQEIHHRLIAIKEEGESKETKESLKAITSNPDLESFYRNFQGEMNRILLAHQVIETGLVERSTSEEGWMEKGLEAAGEHIPIPGAKLVAKILKKAAGAYREIKAERRTETLSGLYVSPVEMSEGTEQIARVLTEAYREPIEKLKEPEAFASIMVKRLLVYWCEYTPDDGLTEMENIVLYLSALGRDDVKLPGLREKLPSILREKLLKEEMVSMKGTDERIADYTFFQGIGIRDKDDPTKEYTRTEERASYGYTMGTREQAERLKFFDQSVTPPTRLGTGQSGGPREDEETKREDIKEAVGGTIQGEAQGAIEDLGAEDIVEGVKGVATRAGEEISSAVAKEKGCCVLV